MTKHIASILLCTFSCFACCYKANAQDFITRAKITFEKKINFQRMLNSEDFDSDFLKNIPKYKYSYYNYTFANYTSLYQFEKDSVEKDSFISFDEEEEDNNKKNKPKAKNCIFSNYSNLTTTVGTNEFDEFIIKTDSIKPIKWRITPETRNIAGYECRKAIGRIYDTVYVVAFYCEQIMIKGGPESIQGLPGMILGMAIPRYNTTWFATKIELANFKEDIIAPPTKGKMMTKKEWVDFMLKNYKNIGWKDFKREDLEKEYNQYHFL